MQAQEIKKAENAILSYLYANPAILASELQIEVHYRWRIGLHEVQSAMWHLLANKLIDFKDDLRLLVIKETP